MSAGLDTFAIVAPHSMSRHLDLDAISRCNRQQLLDLPLRGRQSSRRTFRKRHAKLEEHLLQPGRCNRNQQLGWYAVLVLERVRRADWHVGERSGAGNEALLANREGDLAFEDVEAFLLPAVDVWRRTAARGHDGFPHGVLTAGVLSR